MGRRVHEKAYHLVCRGNRKRLRQLLRKHPNLRSSHDAMLIHGALWHNRGMLRWLLEQRVSPDCRLGGTLGNTPLMDAAATGDLKSIETLLQFGADPNALNQSSENPLGYAVTWEQIGAIQLLVAGGALINSTDDSGAGNTQLDIAESSGWTTVAQVLRSLGAKHFDELASSECGPGLDEHQ